MHHFLLYLAQLSGAQVLGKKLQENFGLNGHEGTKLYEFKIRDIHGYIAEYMNKLDELEVTEREKQAMLDECIICYMNSYNLYEELMPSGKPLAGKKIFSFEELQKKQC